MYTRRVVHTFIALVIVCSGLIALVMVSNPHITSIQYQNATVFIRLSEKISEIAEITISPNTTSFEVVADQDRVTLNLDEPLFTGTRYTVTLRANDLTGKTFSTSAQLSTDKMSYVYLDRTALPHSIKKGEVGSTTEKVVYKANTITTFSACKSSLLVATSEASQDSLVFVDTDEKNIALPENELLSSILCSPSSNTEAILLMYDSESFSQASYRVDLQKLQIEKIVDDSGKPITIQWIEYMSDGKTVIYEDISGVIYIDILSDNQKRSIFSGFSSLSRILPNNKGIFVNDGATYATITSDGNSIPSPEYISNSIQPKAYNAKNTDFLYGISQLKNNELTTQLFTQRGGTTTLFAEFSPADTLLVKQDISPDNQYIITYEAEQPVTYDSIKIHQSPKNIRAIIRRSSDGQQLQQVPGSLLQWQLN